MGDTDGQTRRTPLLKAEGAAIVAGAAAFVLAGIVALPLFWGRDLPIAGPDSVGQFVASAGGIVGVLAYVVGRLWMRDGLTPFATTGERRRAGVSPVDVFDTIAIAVAHGVIALLGWLVLGTVLADGFQDATVYFLSASALAATAAAVTGYAVFLSAVNMSLMRLSTVLAAFVVVGILTAMLSAPDPHWWMLHLSALGMTQSISSLSFNLTLIIAGVIVTAMARYGNSILEGIGTALLIPPVYILTTLYLPDIATRAWAFGIISALGGIGAAAGPLIGGLITSAISWRAAFLFQALIIVIILLLSRRLTDPVSADPDRPFDVVGAVLSALGLFVLVLGILAADTSVPLMIALVIAGLVILFVFFWWVRSRERAGKEVLLSTSLFKNRVSNIALITQNLQWVLLMGTSFTVSAYLQVVRGHNAIETGVIFTAATVGLLLTSLVAGRLAKRFSQRGLILTGFVLCIPGVVLLIWLVAVSTTEWSFVPGLFLIGAGLGLMLTPSVNVVQSAFPEKAQGEISGLSRSVSNLGSTLGTAIAGTILVANIDAGGAAYGTAMGALAILGVGGLIAALFLPEDRHRRAAA